MQITYANYHGEILKEQQIQLMNSYIKVYRENNRLKKEEFYDNNIISNTIYYIEFGNSHNELLDLNLDIININEIEDINSDYTKYHSYQYKNGILKSKGLSVRTNHNDVCIMYEELDLLTNLPIYNTLFKLYEDENSGYEFEFRYDSTGRFTNLIVSNDSISFYEQYRPSELDLIPNFEWWSLYSSYYLNAEPAIPDGILIV